MYGNRFYHETTRRYVAIFGTLFNDIQITRRDNSGSDVQTMLVPINYAPMEKLLARLEQDPTLLDTPAITLPRMSFEITGMAYSPERKLTSLTRQVKDVTDGNVLANLYTPAPYDIDFELNIMTKYNEDGTKILEQIVPFFKPDVTVSAKLIDELDLFLDIPIVLTSVTVEDTYEAAFEERRALIWTLTFVMKGYYFGPVKDKKVIKFIEVNTYAGIENPEPGNTITVQPGLTEAGFGTTDINETVPFADISKDDDWKYIVQSVENV